MKKILVLMVLLLASTMGFSQTINVADAGGCAQASDADLTLFASGGSPSRNVYRGIAGNGNIPYQVVWSAGNNRWEIQFDADIANTFSYTTHYSAASTFPNPPDLATGGWVDNGFGCGALTAFSGTGTQSVLANVPPGVSGLKDLGTCVSTSTVAFHLL